MGNLCNGGTKDFVELWEIIHVNIWTQLTERITVKPVQTATSVKRPMSSLPKQILVQSLLYKTTTCLTQPVTTFLNPNEKKPVQNNNYKTLSSEGMRKKTRNNA